MAPFSPQVARWGCHRLPRGFLTLSPCSLGSTPRDQPFYGVTHRTSPSAPPAWAGRSLLSPRPLPLPQCQQDPSHQDALSYKCVCTEVWFWDTLPFSWFPDLGFSSKLMTTVPISTSLEYCKPIHNPFPLYTKSKRTKEGTKNIVVPVPPFLLEACESTLRTGRPGYYQRTASAYKRRRRTPYTSS